MAQSLADKSGLTEFRPSSAGVRAVIGHPIHPDAVRTLERLGGDPSNFAARQLTPRIAGDADLILTMTREHRDEVLYRAPTKLRSTFTISEAAMLVDRFQAQTIADLVTFRPHLQPLEAPDVPDPIGQEQQVFDDLGDELAVLIPKIIGLRPAK